MSVALTTTTTTMRVANSECFFKRKLEDTVEDLSEKKITITTITPNIIAVVSRYERKKFPAADLNVIYREPKATGDVADYS